jgi:hypothetical protein
MGTRTYIVPVHHEHAFLAQVDKTPKLFRPFTLTRGLEGFYHNVRCVEYVWEGVTFVQKEGWTLAARMDWVPGKGASTVHYTTTPVNVDSPRCDHCNTQRDRKATYIAVNEAGETLALGGNCAKLYWGKELKDLMFFPEMDAWLEALAERDGSGGGRGMPVRHAYDVRQVLALTIPHVRKYGYHKSDAPKPTKNDIVLLTVAHDLYGAGPLPANRPSYLKDLTEVEVATDEEVDAVLEWAATQPGDSSFWMTVQGVLKAGWFTPRALGFIVALPHGFAKRPVERSAARISTHVGVVGKRHKVPTTVTVKRVMSFETQFGTMVVTLMEDSVGNVLKSTGKMPDELADEGDVATITFFVKGHSDYRGVAQTEVNRVSLAVGS